jgi:hypothetical protein
LPLPAALPALAAALVLAAADAADVVGAVEAEAAEAAGLLLPQADRIGARAAPPMPTPMSLITSRRETLPASPGVCLLVIGAPL